MEKVGRNGHLQTLRPKSQTPGITERQITARSLDTLAPETDTSGLRNQDKWRRERRERIPRDRRRGWGKEDGIGSSDKEMGTGPGVVVGRGEERKDRVQRGAVGTNSKGSRGTPLSMWTLRGQNQGHNRMHFFFHPPEHKEWLWDHDTEPRATSSHLHLHRPTDTHTDQNC